MILAASLILGSYFGWRHGRSTTGYLRFTICWLVVLVVQTIVLLASSDSIRDRDSGQFDVSYPLVCAAIFALGLVVVTVVAALRNRRRLA